MPDQGRGGGDGQRAYVCQCDQRFAVFLASGFNIARQRAISVLISSENAWGEETLTSPSITASRLVTSGSARLCLSALFTFRTISGGVPAGARAGAGQIFEYLKTKALLL